MVLLVSCSTDSNVTDNALVADRVRITEQFPVRMDFNQENLASPKPFSFGQFIKFKSLSVDHGLSQNTVTSIAEDHHGFLWFGTGDGLNRFDGHQFIVYKHDPDDPDSISDNFIHDIHIDKNGAMWVGTDDGLNKFDAEKSRFIRFQHDPQLPSSLSHDVVNKILEDSSDRLWIGTSGGGLNSFDPENGQFTHFVNDPADPGSLTNNTVSAIFEDSSGGLWIGTRSGLDQLDSQTGKFIHFRQNPPNPYSLAENDVRAIHEDPKGNLWIGTFGGGLAHLDLAESQIYHYRHDPDDMSSLSNDEVRTIFKDSSGGLWIGTSAGLNQFQSNTGEFFRYGDVARSLDPQGSLQGISVLDIHQDRSGVYWVASDQGLHYFDQYLQRFVHVFRYPELRNSLSNNNVSAIIEDQEGNLWVGTDSGLNRSSPLSDQFDQYFHDPVNPASLSSNSINTILQDQVGRIWIGTDNGLNLFDGKKDIIVPYQTDPNRFPRYVGELPAVDLSKISISAISQDLNGVIWLGSTGTGLVRLNPANKRVLVYPSGLNDPESLNGSTILSIFPESQDRIWIGTLRGGLNLFDPATERFKHFLHDPGDPNSISDSTVNSIMQDQTGTLWIGTASGLNKFNPDAQTFIQFHENDGLPNNSINGILEDEEGYLWISTNNGISRLDPHTETFRNFSSQDGLQSSQFNRGAYFKSDAGTLYFGGINGYNSFNPDQIHDSTYIPPIVLTGLTQGGETINNVMAPEDIEEITLHWPANYFEFEFSALNYVQPGNNQHAYKLDPLDQDWTRIGNRRYGRYTNLPGGAYTLRLIGSNNDGVWNQVGESIQIRVVPPFWQTGWFRGSAVLLITLAVFAGYRLRVRNIQVRNERLSAEIDARTRELEQRRQVAEGLREVLVLLNSDLSVEESLNFILCQVNRLTGAQQACLFQARGENDVVVVATFSDQENEKPIPDSDHSLFHDCSQELLSFFANLAGESSSPVITNSQSNLRQFPRLSESAISVAGTFLVIPINPVDEFTGGLVAMFNEERELSAEEMGLLNSFADQASLAIANAHLRSQAEQMAVLSERNRLARDLHDAVTQTLFSASLIAEAIPDIWIADRQEGMSLLLEIQKLNRSALAEMRALLVELRPTSLEESQLPDLLAQLSEVVAGKSDIEVKLDLESNLELPAEVRISLYRIAQEALNNVIKHAHARQASLRLHSQVEPAAEHGQAPINRVTLGIDDDGIGFDPASVPPNHFGVANIHERAQSIGAQVIIDSQPGEGTTIRVIWEGIVEHNE